MTRIAFLGLGAIGAPMARHLAGAERSLTVWNRTQARAQAFCAETGATAALTPAEAVANADIVITCLPTSKDVASLLDGADGVLATMKPGTAFVDCTSGDPATSKRIAERLAERNIGYLDAPVSGGVAGAVAAKLTVMVGGDEALLERVRPTLEQFGARIVHCGAIGAGDALKAVNNALLAMHIWGTAEGLVALEKMGVRSDVALDVINTSSGRSNASMNLFPERVLTRAFPRTFRLALLDKDVGIAADLARDLDVPSPLIQLTSNLFRQAHHALGEEADHMEAVQVVEQQSGAVVGQVATASGVGQ
ncbi:MAG: NAD(P)-dependent oxidoreductase [Phycisphaerae bacterium]|nr:NAD(P)-dependent oxidoreductase [Gemmatimonadaceae bacterium]